MSLFWACRQRFMKFVYRYKHWEHTLTFVSVVNFHKVHLEGKFVKLTTTKGFWTFTKTKSENVSFATVGSLVMRWYDLASEMPLAK